MPKTHASLEAAASQLDDVDDEQLIVVARAAHENYPANHRVVTVSAPARPQRRAHRLAVAAVGLAAAGAIAIPTVALLAVDRELEQNPAQAAEQPDAPANDAGSFPTNAAGETYGSLGTRTLPDAQSQPGQMPDLVAAVGDNGVEGYLRATEYYGPAAALSPGSGLVSSDALEDHQRYLDTLRNRDGLIVHNLYASDGRTVVDTLTASPMQQG